MARRGQRKQRPVRVSIPERLDGPALLALANTGDIGAWMERVREQLEWLRVNRPDLEHRDCPWYSYAGE